MNIGKTDFTTSATKSSLKKQDLLGIRVGEDVVKGSETIKFLGLMLNKELNMTKFIAVKAIT